MNIKYIFTREKNSKFRCPSFAYNIGIKQSKGEIIILSSPEIFHLNDSVDLIVAPLLKNKRILSSPEAEGISFDTTGKVTNYLFKEPTLDLAKDINSLLKWGSKRSRYARKLPFFMGLYKKELMEIGGYDEDFTGYSGDDDDLIWRLKEKGLIFNYCSANIIHLY
ncbi:unnamed protein product, partial [marine sediment metagenome]